jgi:branched-subunit amino acid aminotransferase/4-amino-4-deoxychorismate lyase
MLVVDRHVLDADAHFDRLATSCTALGFPRPDRDSFRAVIAEAATGAAVRCIYVDDGNRWVLHASAIAIPPLTLNRRNGARAITLGSLRRALPEHKMTSYAPCVIGLRRAADAGANEGLFLDANGNVLEGTATNLFAVRNGTLITAHDDILPGIVRSWVLEQGLDIELRSPTIAEVRGGAFVTGSLTGLAPLRSLDGVECNGPGEVFAELSRRRVGHDRSDTAGPARGI